MQIAHTVQTDDGSVRLNLGDGDSIFDLVACGANGQEVTVHLGYYEARYLLGDAGTVRIAMGSGTAAECTTRTLGGVVDRDQRGGEVTFTVDDQAAAYTLTVADGAGSRTTLAVGGPAHDSLIVGISTMLSQL